MATRWPAKHSSASLPCTCMLRILQVLSTGYISSWSSLRIRPEISVPVTMVPNPDMENALSMGSRGMVSMSLGVTSSSAMCSIRLTRLSRPAPVTLETSAMGALSQKLPFSSSRMSSFTISNQSSSTRSHLFSTIMHFSIPSRPSISTCSRVWGIMPSSAAMTSSTRSMPTTPATMLFTNFSCPGTSIMPTLLPLGRSNQVKPRSMVMPLRCSSSQRSVLRPVSALMRVVLPWSMCPAVPTIIFFIFYLPPVSRRPPPR